MFRLTRSVLLVVGVSLGLVMAPAVPASAHGGGHRGAEVTTGSFVTLPGGVDLGYAVRGRTTMVRVGDRTLVGVRVGGLDARTSYPAHVHNAPCATPTFGGSHYQHEPGGAVDDVNEMWPRVTTNRGGRGLGFAVHGHRARAEAMSIVIHYPLDTSIRLACVDLT
jgi:hypothetical protein